MNYSGHHFIAIFGGAVAGSEAAFQLASKGFRVVVFDQNTLPYGKIEDGLPKWHNKLRDKEEQKINEKLSHPNVTFVPNVTLGKDIDFIDVANNWGFTAVLLATGAWKDRPIPIEGIDEYINKGLYYQNPFVYWYNHFHEPDFTGESYEIHDDSIVIGGGLASLDVMKILMMEKVEQALSEKGISTNMFKLERGINKVLEEKGLTLNDLGLKGSTLFYRRRAKDMPLSSFPTDTPEQKEKAMTVNQKIFDNYQKKYLFRFEPCWSPVDKVIENDSLVGIKFQKNEIKEGKLKPVPGEFKTYRAPVFISSIGSIPQPIKGIPCKGQVYHIDEESCCRLEGFENVFALGNAVTGRGNIIESQKHSKEVSLNVMQDHLHWQEEDYQSWLRSTEEGINQQVQAIANQIQRQRFMPVEVIEKIIEKTHALQQRVGYDNNYPDWVEKNVPKRLEELIAHEG